MKILQRVRERATEEPNAFMEALVKGEVKSVDSDQILESDEDEDVDMLDAGAAKMPNGLTNGRDTAKKDWERLPRSQNVVRCPTINWTQYAVVGDSLDKMHQDQLARPSEGMPQRFVDGQYQFGGEGQRRPAYLGNVIDAPYTPGRDLVEKPGARKAGKR